MIIKHTLIVLFSAFIVFSLKSCLPPVEGCTDPTANNYYEFAEKDDGSCYYSGKIAFWTDVDHGCGPIEVLVNGGSIGKVSQPIPTGLTDCSNPDALIVELTPGNYDIYARDSCSNTWSGTVAVESITCTSFKFGK